MWAAQVNKTVEHRSKTLVTLLFFREGCGERETELIEAN